MMINDGTDSIKRKYRIMNFQCLCIASRIWAGLSCVQFPAGARDFYVLQNVQTSSGVHLALYSPGAGDFFLGGTVMGA